jgi:hypothetical protein
MEIILKPNKYKKSLDYIITPKPQDFSQEDKTQPFRNIFGTEKITGALSGGESAAEVAYSKRGGGSWIYCNNPEMLDKEDIGQALLRNHKMSGDFVFTLEHSNFSGGPFYLGYQLFNTSGKDAAVTVYNIGYQTEGEWLGQKEWSDYFNSYFRLPEDYFIGGGRTMQDVNPIYFGLDYVLYKPRVFEPLTVTVPPGKYIYVLGGTAADAHNQTNFDSTADRPVGAGKCVNGVVKFRIEGGEMQGTLYCYTGAEQVKANPREQGYIISRNGKNYASQYKGTDPSIGLIESDICWVVGDKTNDGRLKVKYTKEEDTDCRSKAMPYQEYSMKTKEVTGDYWLTALNPNTASAAIGTDMMIFNCVDTDGNPVVVDTRRADGIGRPANLGNWMVQYTDNFTFANAGSKPRKFRIFKRGSIMSGAIAYIVRNDNGQIIDSQLKVNPYAFSRMEDVLDGMDKSLIIEKNGHFWLSVDGRPYCDIVDGRCLVYELTVPAMTVERVSVDYVILANSNGSIYHWVELS